MPTTVPSRNDWDKITARATQLETQAATDTARIAALETQVAALVEDLQVLRGGSATEEVVP